MILITYFSDGSQITGSHVFALRILCDGEPRRTISECAAEDGRFKNLQFIRKLVRAIRQKPVMKRIVAECDRDPLFVQIQISAEEERERAEEEGAMELDEGTRPFLNSAA